MKVDIAAEVAVFESILYPIRIAIVENPAARL